jgi:hypothetical protein
MKKSRKPHPLIFVVVYLLLAINCRAQNNGWSLAISNNVTALPVVGYPRVFYSQYHPGLEAARFRKINKKSENIFYLKANGGFYYHRFIQTLIWIYPSVIYERVLNKRFAMDVGLGFGYGFSIEGSDVFKLNSDGHYERVSKLAGRSQYIGQLEIGGRYVLQKDHPDGLKLIVQLKNYVQGTYINFYVPLLPINSFLIGLSVPIKSK